MFFMKNLLILTSVLFLFGLNSAWGLGCPTDCTDVIANLPIAVIKDCLADHIEEAKEAVESGDNETGLYEIEAADNVLTVLLNKLS